MQYEGYSIRALAAQGWETKVVFDDSILQDRQTNINEGVLLTTNGLMSKKKFLMDKLGYTEEEAEQELAEIQKENGVTMDALDFSMLGTREGVEEEEPKIPLEENKAEEAEEDELEEELQ